MSEPKALSITIDNLSKQFPGSTTCALNQLSLNICAGKITGLAGPDGAGKTTLLRLIAGLLQPTAGTVTINGLDSQQDALELHTHIGYMPQKFGLYEDLTVIENLTLYAELREVSTTERSQTFSQLLGFTNLAPFQSRLAGKLSGGMKQKLGLACALLGKPKLLLLDEPSVGVDPISRRELWKMVQSLKSSGLTIIWSTAYLDEAEKCEEVILLNQGNKLYTGSPQKLIANVDNRTFTLSHITANERRNVLASLQRQTYIIDTLIQGANIHILTDPNTHQLSTEKLGIKPPGDIATTTAKFEDAFIDLLGGHKGGVSQLAHNMPAKAKTAKDIVKADKLTKQFADFIAVNGVSFAIKQGEIFGLLGPNGAGKSTIFQMLCGLIAPTGGHAWINQLSLTELPSIARSRIGYMAQKFSLYGNLSVLQNLKFFSKIYGLKGQIARDKINMMIDIFDFKHFLNANADDLPLGYKQRLALACSVIHEPDVLFLDEPTSGVDPLTRREFWNHINGLTEKGVTIMITTHFMDEAEYCDRIALIFKGNNIATGTPDQLKSQVVSEKLNNPSLEDAFIELVNQSNTPQSAGNEVI